MTRGRPPRPTGRDARLVRVAPDIYDLLAADASRLGVSVPARLDEVLRGAVLSPPEVTDCDCPSCGRFTNTHNPRCDCDEHCVACCPVLAALPE